MQQNQHSFDASTDLSASPEPVGMGDYVKYEYERVFLDVAVSVKHKGAGYVQKVEPFRPRPYLVRVSETKTEWLCRPEITEVVARQMSLDEEA